jgi:hypothetical protein
MGHGPSRTLASVLVLSLAVPAASAIAPPPSPLPSEGAVAPMAGADLAAGQAARPEVETGAQDDAVPRKASRDEAVRLRQLRREHFGSVRSPELRAKGLAALSEFGTANSIELLYAMLRREKPDVRDAMLDRIDSFGAKGQAALTWIAIEDPDAAMRTAATARIDRPATPATLGVLDLALRQNAHATVNRAGALAGTLNALPAIPLLIFAQVASDEVADQGDLAWIAMGTQRSYVSNVAPVLGDGSGAFTPIVDTILQGFVLRVTDAVAVTYRADAHHALVAMTGADWGKPTGHLGYDPKAWWAWYNDEYVPFKRAQAAEAAAREKAERAARGGEGDPLE